MTIYLHQTYVSLSFAGVDFIVCLMSDGRQFIVASRGDILVVANKIDKASSAVGATVFTFPQICLCKLM